MLWNTWSCSTNSRWKMGCEGRKSCLKNVFKMYCDVNTSPKIGKGGDLRFSTFTVTTFWCKKFYIILWTCFGASFFFNFLLLWLKSYCYSFVVLCSAFKVFEMLRGSNSLSYYLEQNFLHIDIMFICGRVFVTFSLERWGDFLLVSSNGWSRSVWSS